VNPKTDSAFFEDALGEVPSDFHDQRDYVTLFHEHLDISVKEERFRIPEEQLTARPRAVLAT
jgi:hypothetical protein